MSVSLYVTHVTLDHDQPPHRQIQALHGALPGRDGAIHWTHTLVQAMTYIEQKHFNYVIVQNQQAVHLVLGYARNGERFLKAPGETEAPRHLLALPQLDLAGR
jgi:hypothetical protein